MIESIQQFDIIYAMTQGGPGDRLTVFQVEAYLNFFQSTNVGRSAALLMILWVITFILSNIFIKNWLRLRERARGTVLRRTTWNTPVFSNAILRGHRHHASGAVLHVPDLLDRAHVVPDQPVDPARATVDRLRTHPEQLHRT